jgi:hypothetical protein
MPAPGPYGPMSPVSPSYPHPNQVPMPLSVPPPPPAHPSTQGPQSPTAPYPQPTPLSAVHQRYPAPSEQNGAQKSSPQEGFGPRGDRRMSGGPGFRRPSFGGGRRPPCLFFPLGRCRNGCVYESVYSMYDRGAKMRCRDDCRFPHVLVDGHVVGRAGRFRSPPQNTVNANAQANLEEKLANPSITEVSQLTAFFSFTFSRDTFFVLFDNLLMCL